MADSKTFVCPKCNGEKQLFIGKYQIDEQTGEYRGVTHPCDFCQGSGNILESLRELYISNV